jgi:secreted trypsin-like serine protease
MHLDSGNRTRRAVLRFAAVVVLVPVLVSATGGLAFGVVGGKTVPITAVPWTVVIWKKSPSAGEPPYAGCTGVIIGPRYVLTAGHCVMSGNSAKPLPDSSIGVEAGTSNFERLPAADHPQASSVAAVLVMPGYIATSKLTSRNETQAAGHDLAVLRLSRAFDFKGDEVRAGSLPSANTPKPSDASQLVVAGFGDEKLTGTRRFNGTLNEAVKPRVVKSCTTTRVLCMYLRTNACFGDSGSGAVEPGQVPTVVGIFSLGLSNCYPGRDYLVSLAAPATLRFIKSST